MRQYLVRHGESVSNIEGRVQGQIDVELSAFGREQARRTAAWCRTVAADGVTELWSSPLRRARETAAEIAAATGLVVRIEPQLAELHAGIFQGHLWAELEERFPGEVARWRSGDVDYEIPGGESRARLATRGREALERLADRGGPGMIVVAHGGVLTAALGALLGHGDSLLAAAAERPFTRLPALENCSVTTLEWPGPRLLAFNDTAHLATVRSDGGPASAAGGI